MTRLDLFKKQSIRKSFNIPSRVLFPVFFILLSILTYDLNVFEALKTKLFYLSQN